MDAFFRPRIAVVSTRSLAKAAGRPTILANIISALEQKNDVTAFRLYSALELGSIGGLCRMLGQWLTGMVCGRRLPLQCILYATRECERLSEQIADGAFDSVYLDTVRCHALLVLLRQRLPHLHIVTDFDDLMSRRMRHLSQSRLPLLAGHIGNHLPHWLRFLVEGPFGRSITAYEAATLPGLEDHVVALSSATVVLSTVEAGRLRGRLPISARPCIHSIPPAFAVQADPWKSAPALRFVFVGGDDLLQNRMAIDRLLALWRTLRPATSLHIFGRQGRRPTDLPGVHWHGFVQNADAIYSPGSIALLPALVKGGIKTKVAEAWAWGCPVLGNDAAFEGFAIRNYPLALPETVWNHFLVQPAAYASTWLDAARRGHEIIRREMSPAVFVQRWNDLMMPFAERPVQEMTAQLRVATG